MLKWVIKMVILKSLSENRINGINHFLKREDKL